MGRARIVNQIASDPNCHCQQPKVYDVLSFICNGPLRKDFLHVCELDEVYTIQ